MGRKTVTIEQKVAIKTLLSQNFSHSEIAKQVGCSRKAVYNIKQKLEQGLPLGNKLGQGRRRATTEAQDRYLLQLAKKNRTHSSRQLTSEWSNVLGKPISTRTTRGRLVEHALKSYTQKPRPFRNKNQIKKRLSWCREHINWTKKDWERVIFSDESHFEVVNRKNRRFVRRTREEHDTPFSFIGRQQGGGGTLSVWGCFTVNGTGPLIFYDGRLNARSYIELLSDVLPEYIETVYGANENYFFQQDNAPCHKAKYSLQWFQNQNIKLLDWPPTSPDLNPIENLWSVMDQKLANYQVHTTAQLREAITDIWSKITIETCVNLIHSVPKRIEMIRRVRGGSISSY